MVRSAYSSCSFLDFSINHNILKIMDIDFSHYRMNNYSWIDNYKEKLGVDTFRKFQNAVYDWLLKLKKGESIDMVSNKQITDQNRDLFIKTVCLFISEGNGDYEFNEKYTKVTHR